MIRRIQSKLPVSGVPLSCIIYCPNEKNSHLLPFTITVFACFAQKRLFQARVSSYLLSDFAKKKRPIFNNQAYATITLWYRTSWKFERYIVTSHICASREVWCWRTATHPNTLAFGALHCCGTNDCTLYGLFAIRAAFGKRRSSNWREISLFWYWNTFYESTLIDGISDEKFSPFVLKTRLLFPCVDYSAQTD